MGKGGGVLQTLTSGGQTPSPISTIFNRFPEGTMSNIYTQYEVPTSKIVGSSLFTDIHTDRQTDRHTHRHDRKHDSCPSSDGQL